MKDDAHRFCSGEWPCEASTAAASLERERNELRQAIVELRRPDKAEPCWCPPGLMHHHTETCRRVHALVSDW